MRARLVQLLERLLDRLWDLTLPVSGTCPVCAFYRGLLGGIIVGMSLWALL